MIAPHRGPLQPTLLATVAAVAPSVEVRPARPADIAPVSASLARAFEDDPVMEWLFPARNRLRRLERFFAVEAGFSLRKGTAYTAVDHAGAALWMPPGQWKVGAAQMIRTAPTMIRLLGSHLFTALAGLGVIERAHPGAPHFYLSVLGTDPARQGHGVGGAAMRPVLDRCDHDGLGAYLESSKEVNISYYERFGFEVTAELQMPKGPKVWGMWRDPQEPAA